MRLNDASGDNRVSQARKTHKKRVEAKRGAPIKEALKLASKMADALINSTPAAGGAALHRPDITRPDMGHEALRTAGIKGFFRDPSVSTGWSYTDGRGNFRLGIKAPGLARNGVIVADDDGFRKTNVAGVTIGGLGGRAPVADVPLSDIQDIEAHLGEATRGSRGVTRGGERAPVADAYQKDWDRVNAHDPIYEQLFGRPRMAWEDGTPWGVRLGGVFDDISAALLGSKPAPPVRHTGLYGPPGQVPLGAQQTLGARAIGQTAPGTGGGGLYPTAGTGQAMFAARPYPLLIP